MGQSEEAVSGVKYVSYSTYIYMLKQHFVYVCSKDKLNQPYCSLLNEWQCTGRCPSIC